MLEDLLAPKEMIVFRRKDVYEVRGEAFNELVITNQRLIFYKRTGLLFRKDNSSSIGISNLKGVKFHEKGLIRKKGVAEIYLEDGTIIPLEGDASRMKYLYQNLISKIE